jgi:hypothetical protein
LINETLPWRNCKDDKDDIKKMKEICLADPERKLFLNTSKGKREIVEVFIHIKSLTYEQRPDYSFIRIRLEELLTKEYIKMNYIGPNCVLYDMPEKGISESPSKEPEMLCKSSKNVVNSSFTGTNNLIFPFPTAFDNYSNLLDTSLNKNLINTSNRKLLYGMKYNDPNLNISNFHFGLQNDIMGNTNRLSLFNNQATSSNNNQMTKKKRKREGSNVEWYEEEVNDLFNKEKDNIQTNNNLTNNIPFNNIPMNNLPITNPNAQNQIFIINQFNKSNMTDLEKCLLNFLIPKAGMNMPCYQGVGNEQIPQQQAKPTTGKDSTTNNADKLLINNIKEKLKPVNPPQKVSFTEETNPVLNTLGTMQPMQMPTMPTIPFSSYNSLNTMFPNNIFNNNLLGNNLGNNLSNNLGNNLNNGQLMPDMNMLINNYTNLANQNPLFTNINQTFNNFNNLSSMEMLKSMMKLYEPTNGIDMSKINYGYPGDMLNNNITGYNMFNNEVLEQLKQNVGCYGKIINDLFASSNKQSNMGTNKNVKKKGVRLFKIEKMKK